MANAILNVLLKFLTKMVSLLLTPLNLFLQHALPNLDSSFAVVNDFFELILDYGRFALSYLGLTQDMLSLIVLLYIPIISIPVSVHIFKLVCKWWEALT